MGESKTSIIGGVELGHRKIARELLEEIFSSKKVVDAAGNSYILESNIDREEGKFLENLIKNNSYTASFEVGCAYGISSLSICNGLPEQDGHHTIIDPFQFNEWKGIGIENLKKANFHNFQLIEKPSEVALPELLSNGSKFDFAFIDGWHTFDHTLLDMYYTNRLLKVGGIMVIDDVGMKGVEKAVNYFLNYPAYKFEAGVLLKKTTKRSTFSKFILNPIKQLVKLLPTKVSEEIFSPGITTKAIEGYSMVALKKIKEDERPWNWFKTF